MSYLKKKPTITAAEHIPKKLHKEHPKKNNLEGLIGIVVEEPRFNWPAEHSLDKFKYWYNVIVGHTSHCSGRKMKEEMLEQLERETNEIRDKIEELWRDCNARR